ncbi:MAG: uroporphyrinogen-III C-methyltransferase [Aestuariibacter sp.]
MKKPTDPAAQVQNDSDSKQESSMKSTGALESEQQSSAAQFSAESTRNQKSQRKVSKPVRQETKVSEAKAARVWPWILLNLIFVVLFAGVSYFAWQQWQGFKSAQSDQYQLVLQDLGKQATDFEVQVQQRFSSEFEKLNAHNEQQDIRLAEQQMEIAENAGRNQLQWTLAEAQFLVRMAGRKIWLEQDVVTAIALLQSADRVLKDAHAPEFLPVREAISQDISALRAEAVLDIANIALQLNSLHSAVDNLSFVQPESFYQESEQQVSDDVSDWRRNLAVIWQSIKENFISIERVDTPIAPFVSRKLQLLKRSELSLQLIIAQSALLERQQDYYQAALKKALRLLQYFDASTLQFQAMQNELQELSALVITADVPDDLKTLPVLRRFMESSSTHFDPQQD